MEGSEVDGRQRFCNTSCAMDGRGQKMRQTLVPLEMDRRGKEVNRRKKVTEGKGSGKMKRQPQWRQRSPLLITLQRSMTRATARKQRKYAKQRQQRVTVTSLVRSVSTVALLSQSHFRRPCVYIAHSHVVSLGRYDFDSKRIRVKLRTYAVGTLPLIRVKLA